MLPVTGMSELAENKTYRVWLLDISVCWKVAVYLSAFCQRFCSIGFVFLLPVIYSPRYWVPWFKGMLVIGCGLLLSLSVIVLWSSGVDRVRIPWWSGVQWYVIAQHFLWFREPPMTLTSLFHHWSWSCACCFSVSYVIGGFADAWRTTLSMNALRLQSMVRFFMGSVIVVGTTLVWYASMRVLDSTMYLRAASAAPWPAPCHGCAVKVL